MTGASSRILYDIPCKVCQDHSSGKHYGIFACDGCAGFFKRSIRRQRQYLCKAKEEGTCVVDKTHRNQCRACRLNKCIQVGMNKDAVQHERGPRNSTLRRQMALYFRENNSPPPVLHSGGGESHHSPLHSRTPPINPPTPRDPIQPAPGSSGVSPFSYLSSYASHQLAAAFFCPIPASVHNTLTGPLWEPSLTFANTKESVCEAAARLLFMNVQWTKSMETFTSLPLSDQLSLLEVSWRDLFILGAAQFLLPLHLLRIERELIDETLVQNLHVFQEVIGKFKQLNIDSQEYIYLRAILLFNPAPESFAPDRKFTPKKLESPSTVTQIQDHFQLLLTKYIASAKPTEPCRVARLLVLLPQLKTVSSSAIEELFFRRTIGLIPIERIICDMYRGNEV